MDPLGPAAVGAEPTSPFGARRGVTGIRLTRCFNFTSWSLSWPGSPSLHSPLALFSRADFVENAALCRAVVVACRLAQLAGKAQRGIAAVGGQFPRQRPQRGGLAGRSGCVDDEIAHLVDQPVRLR